MSPTLPMIYEHTGLVQTTLLFTALRYYTRYFPIASNEPEVLNVLNQFVNHSDISNTNFAAFKKK